MDYKDDIPEDRPLTEDERLLAAWMLEHGTPGARTILPQLAAARVTSRCPCGCASVNFTIEGHPNPGGGLHVLGEFLYGSDSSPYGAFIFEQGGVLGGLEVWSLAGEDVPATLPRRESLRPAPFSTTADRTPATGDRLQVMSAGSAAAIGLLWVNGPVAFCLFGVPILSLVAFPDHPWVGFAAFPVGFVLAWLCWSYTVPRWRLWAFARADDVPRLKNKARQLGITWPDGDFFEPTEFRWPGYEADLKRVLEHRSGLDQSVAGVDQPQERR